MNRLDRNIANQNLNDLVHRGIKCLDSYKGKTADKHSFLCLVEGCNNVWEAPYSTVVTMKHGCKQCALQKNYLPSSEAQNKLDSLFHRNIKCLDKYKNNTQLKHKFQCLVEECGHIWEAPYNIVVNRGSGCIKCRVQKTRISKTEAQNKLDQLVNRNIKCLDTYKGSQLKHRFKCLVEECGHTWEAKYTNVINRKSGCKKCSKTYISPIKAQNNLNELKIRNIECLEKYRGSGKSHSFKCLVPDCGHNWDATYNDVVNVGYGCAKCAGNMKKVGEEKELADLRIAIRKRIKSALLRATNNYSFSSVHESNLIDYCVKEYLIILPKPNKDLTLDHIIPLSFFDPTSDIEMKFCWNANNLRWLTRSENCSKNNKIVFDLFSDWHYLVYNLVTNKPFDEELALTLLQEK